MHRILLYGLGGLLLTIGSAWGLAAWSPKARDTDTRWYFIISPHHVDAANPVGVWMHYEETGAGVQIRYPSYVEFRLDVHVGEAQVELVTPSDLRRIEQEHIMDRVLETIDTKALEQPPGDPDYMIMSWRRLGPHRRVAAWGWPCRALMWMKGELTRQSHEAQWESAVPLPIRERQVLDWFEKLSAEQQQRYLDRVGRLPIEQVHAALPLQPLWPGLLANTAFFAAILWLLLLAMKLTFGGWRRWRGRCGSCGYILHETAHICSECGAAARPPVHQMIQPDQPDQPA